MTYNKAAEGKRRVFIAFAIEDETQRDFLVGQSRNIKVPFELIDMSVKEPYTEKWKTQCRTKIKGCHGMIALISENTAKSDGQKWEMVCAKSESIPLIGMYAYNYDGRSKPSKPAELGSNALITWNWQQITDFISDL